MLQDLDNVISSAVPEQEKRRSTIITDEEIPYEEQVEWTYQMKR